MIARTMLALVALSLPFAVFSARLDRLWTIALPVAIWGTLALLQEIGVLRVFSGSAAQTLVLSGAAFALGGLVVRRILSYRRR